MTKASLLLCGMCVFMLCCSASLVVAEPIGRNDSEIQNLASPILQNVLASLKSGNYGQYTKDFDALVKESVPESKFVEVKKKIDESLGACTSTQYLGALIKGDMTLTLWKARFEKSKDDTLLKLIISKRADAYFVTGLWFE